MDENVIHILQNTRLFAGLNKNQVDQIMNNSGTFIKKYRKEEYLFMEEDTPVNLFVLISGKINVAEDTISGKRIVITDIDEPGSMFGEVYLFMNCEQYRIHAQAMEDSTVIVMSNSIFQEENILLMKNLLSIFAEKAWLLSGKIQILGGGSLREKIVRLIYFRQKTNATMIQLKRDDMADLLHVARPSLSRELAKMQREGILQIDGRTISVKDQDLFEQYL